MIRTLSVLSVLALTAAFAVPASAETSVRVTLTGKSQAEVYAAIAGAARSVCSEPVAGELHDLSAVELCVQDTIAASMLKAKLAPRQQPVAFVSGENAIRVELTGKSPAEAYTAIAVAARSVCNHAALGEVTDLYGSEACFVDTVDKAVARAKSPALSQYARGTNPYQHLASN